MTWAKLDDQVHSHPKTMAAGDEAFGLWCRALSWCANHLTDGRLPAQWFDQAVPDASKREELLARLLEVGFLDESPRGYAIHDYLDIQRSKKQVEQDRAAKKKGGQKGAESRWRKGENGSTHGSTKNGTHPKAGESSDDCSVYPDTDTDSDTDTNSHTKSSELETKNTGPAFDFPIATSADEEIPF